MPRASNSRLVTGGYQAVPTLRKGGGVQARAALPLENAKTVCVFTLSSSKQSANWVPHDRGHAGNGDNRRRGPLSVSKAYDVRSRRIALDAPHLI